MKIPDSREIFTCRHCLTSCYHSPICNGEVSSGEKYRKTFKLFECEHCRNVSLATYTWEHPGSMIGDSYIAEVKRFPPEIYRNKPNWYNELDNEYTSILDEVYEALDNSLFTLASSCVRTAIERILATTLGDIGGFEKKLKSLLEQKIIDLNEYELLEAIIDAGSASVHRGFSPDQESIGHMMEITEHIFYELCIRKSKSEKLSEMAKQLKKSTPQRNKA